MFLNCLLISFDFVRVLEFKFNLFFKDKSNSNTNENLSHKFILVICLVYLLEVAWILVCDFFYDINNISLIYFEKSYTSYKWIFKQVSKQKASGKRVKIWFRKSAIQVILGFESWKNSYALHANCLNLDLTNENSLLKKTH